MSNWRAMLKEAKELLDEGFINEQDYEKMKQEALALRSQGVSDTSSINEDDLSGETQMFTGTESIDDELSSDTLAGTTQFVPEADVDDLSSDTLAGGTQFVPDFDMDADSDTLSGVTMMGKVVSLNDDNIENLPAGTVFDGRYSVVAPLGKGGMGMVYEVVDPKVKQRVALKVLRPEIANNPKVIQSFA